MKLGGNITARVFRRAWLLCMAAIFLAGCDTVVENRIPAMPVSIDLANPGTWSTYGVAGFGDYNYFVYMT
ncbi:MAG: hypothetical protein K2H86_02815, partial [Muribaculaceae bacterium]|nr:hypothetical protein [Muribaculaceae bacterium]